MIVIPIFHKTAVFCKFSIEIGHMHLRVKNYIEKLKYMFGLWLSISKKKTDLRLYK